VVQSLEAALWAFYNSSSFEQGCLMAVNLGDDADTTGAVYGQIAGAYYGKSGIPEKWLKRLAHQEVIEEFASGLYVNSIVEKSIYAISAQRQGLQCWSSEVSAKDSMILTI
jgi:hypothetical protein